MSQPHLTIVANASPTSRQRSRILFVHNGRERFVLDDLSILRGAYSVSDWYQPTRHYNPWRLLNLVQSHDLVFSWFASWHSLAPTLLARRLGKPTITVVGGYDTACVPEANYGSQRGGMRRIISRLVILASDQLIAFSNTARHEAINNAGVQPQKILSIHLGVTPLPFGSSPREPIALTVGGVWHENLLRKGMLPFVQAAAYMPEVRFVLVGRWYDDSIEVLREAAGPNVEFCGFVSDEELTALYARAAVYVQASLHEGFGLSVAEAMSAGCIPVVTRCGSLPEVVGAHGLFVKSTDPAELASGIRQALARDDRQRFAIRSHVLETFAPERRIERMLELVHTCLTKKYTTNNHQSLEIH
ncbi:MAG: glycosyltransferase family 4 protein [Oscillochloridaceae bacterium umkhey_bin13]